MLKRKKLCLFIFSLFSFISVIAQLDYEHFIPPMYASPHSWTTPGVHVLYISTPSINPINYTVKNGAGAIMQSGTVSNANPVTYSMNGYGSELLFNKASLNSVKASRGLHIEADNKVYCNVRVRSNNNSQAGSLTTKGRQALGKSFRIGHYFNAQAYNQFWMPPEIANKSSFVGVMATEDGTIVTYDLTWKKPKLEGNSPENTNSTFDITLEKGETYVIAIHNQKHANNVGKGMIGSLISSNKPIAVNCGSWGGNRRNDNTVDIGIDQIVATSKLGTEYIAVRGASNNNTDERVMIVAHEDNTEVYVKGQATPIATIAAAGGHYEINGSHYGTARAMFIETSKPAAAFQFMMGKDADFFRSQGMNFLPPINCRLASGVNNIPDISKIGTRNYGGAVSIVTLQGSTISITQNGNPVAAGASTAIPGSNYVYYKKTGLSGDIAIQTNSVALISLVGQNDDAGYGGFFTGFDLPEVAQSGTCAPAFLYEPDDRYDSYQWHFNGSPLTGETNDSLYAEEAGDYYYVYTFNSCTDTSEVISMGAMQPFTITSESEFCFGDSTQVTIEGAIDSISWSTGDTNRVLFLNSFGTTSLRIYGDTAENCFVDTSITMTQLPNPVIPLRSDTSICNDDSIDLDIGNLGNDILWSTGETSSTINVNTSGIFSVRVINNNGCIDSADATIGTFSCATDGEITKTDEQLTYTPSATTTYTIVAKNNGPVDFTDAIVSDPLPDGFTEGDFTWTVVTHGGATSKASGIMVGALEDTVDIPLNDSVVYTVNLDVPSSKRDDLINTATITLDRDTFLLNNTATDVDTFDCTFAISGVVNSRTQNWTRIGTVVGGFTYNFNPAGGTKTFIATNGPEDGQEITTVVYNTGTGWSISMARNRYNNSNSYEGTITGTYDNSPHSWTGLSGTSPENAPILGFMAFIDRDGNGSYNSDADDFIRDINSLTITPDNSGELYMAFYDNGSYADNNGVINIDASITPPSLDFDEDTIVCAGITLELDAENPGASSWEWNTGDNTQIIQADSSGEYSVVVTGAGGCVAEDTINVTIDTVIVNLRSDTSFCFGDSLLLDAGNSGADSWNWNTGDNAQTIYIYSSGEYIVDVTNSSGCTSEEDTINITVNALPIIDLGEDTSICSGESILFEGPLGGSSIWSTNETSSSISTDTAGIYSIEYTDGNNCTNSDTVVLTINTLPDVNLRQDTTLCKGDNLVIDAGPFESWLWNTGENTQVINVDTSGLYKVTVFNTFNCSDSDSVIINIAPLPTIDLGPADTTICLENLYELDAGNSGETFLWSSGEETQTITPNEAGIYLVTVTLGTGCFAIDSIQIDTFITPSPNLNVPDTAICEGDSVEVSAIAGFESYSWTNDASTSNSAILTLEGKYFLSVTNNNGCVGIDSLNLTVNPLPTIGLEDSSKFCSFGQLTLYANEFGADYAWSTGESDREIIVNTLGTFWVKVTTAENCELSDTTIVYEDTLHIDLGEDASFCEGNSVSLDAGDFVTEIWNSSDTSSTFTIDESGAIRVLAIDSEGCFGRDTIIVTKNPNPSLSLTQQDSAICDLIGETTSASVVNSEDMNIIWSTGESGETTSISDTGWIKATKTNEFECSVKDSVFVNRECEDKTFNLPNIFTPDDDGTNETFVPIEDPITLSTYFSVIQFVVYNRWGRIVYISRDKLPHWEGIYQDTGNPCPSGTYFWIVDYQNIYGEQKKLNGYVQLVRKSGT